MTASASSPPMTGTRETRACRVRLPASPEAPGAARRRVRDTIDAWNIPADADAADTAVLIVSELVTNALLHADGGIVTLAIRCTGGQLRVDVYDGSPEPPVVEESEPGQLADGGRGLVLVAALAGTWGWYRTPGGGKAVHASISPQDAR